MSGATDTARISPTAHYTGSVWRANGLGDARFDVVLEHRPHTLFSPGGRLVAPLLGGATLDSSLLQRHLLIDHLVRCAVEAGARQVIEVPAGFSARGLRLGGLAGGLTWVDGDLENMVAMRKKALGSEHPIRVVDLLRDDGPHSLDALCAALDPELPTVIIVEGLFNYFSTRVIKQMWARCARALSRFPQAWLLGDAALGNHVRQNPLVRLFLMALSGVARGSTHAHFDGPPGAVEALHAAGFPQGVVHSPKRWAAQLSLPAGHAPDYLCVLEGRLC